MLGWRIMREVVLWLFLTVAASTPGLAAFNDFEEPPHRYWETPPRDAATRLHERMSKGEVQLPGGDPIEFLKAYLRELKIPESSQTLVISKTALQRQFVHAGNPRAIYFNDDVSVGYIPGGRLEVAAVDPVLGGIFYIFDAPKSNGEVPKFERSRRCLGCHAGSFTSFLPGLMTNSVHVQADGRVVYTARAHFSGHAAPLSDRWGGWLVTGAPAGMAHLGNQLSSRGPDGLIKEPMGELGKRFDPKQFPHGARSEAAALLVLDHTLGAVNRLMETNYRMRTALLTDGLSAEADGALGGEALEEARSQSEVLTRYLLFSEEAALPPSGIDRDGGFAASYEKDAPVDAGGRSLRDLSLEGRLFRYRCSPMVYSTAFQGLPLAFRTYFWSHLKGVLESDPVDPAAAHLPDAERAAIISILNATVPDYSRSAE